VFVVAAIGHPVHMRLFVERAAREHIDAHGGAVFLWPKLASFWPLRTFVLESATEPPDLEFELVHAADGFQVFTTPGLIEPEELHLELSRRGRLRAYWNNQAWIG
jgi:hypothetical protein